MFCDCCGREIEDGEEHFDDDGEVVRGVISGLWFGF